jgi:hypothetical protein
MAGPLAHLRVVDLTDLRDTLAGRLLADLGADVVKVEPPGGDPGRLHAPFAGGVAAPDRSLAFVYRNLNKRTLALDLHAPADAARFRALCDAADVCSKITARTDGRCSTSPPEAARAPPQPHPRRLTDFGREEGPRAQNGTRNRSSRLPAPARSPPASRSAAVHAGGSPRTTAPRCSVSPARSSPA